MVLFQATTWKLSPLMFGYFLLGQFNIATSVVRKPALVPNAFVNRTSVLLTYYANKILVYLYIWYIYIQKTTQIYKSGKICDTGVYIQSNILQISENDAWFLISKPIAKQIDGSMAPPWHPCGVCEWLLLPKYLQPFQGSNFTSNTLDIQVTARFSTRLLQVIFRCCLQVFQALPKSIMVRVYQLYICISHILIFIINKRYDGMTV